MNATVGLSTRSWNTSRVKGQKSFIHQCSFQSVRWIPWNRCTCSCPASFHTPPHTFRPHTHPGLHMKHKYICYTILFSLTQLLSSSLSVCLLPFSLSLFHNASMHTHTPAQTHTHMHAPTLIILVCTQNTKLNALGVWHFLLSLHFHLCLSVCLSLTHTHRHKQLIN